MIWKETQPDTALGIYGTIWALKHAIEVNAGGINGPICIGIMQKEGASYVTKILTEEETQEHIQLVEEFESKIRDITFTPAISAIEIPNPE